MFPYSFAGTGKRARLLCALLLGLCIRHTASPEPARLIMKSGAPVRNLAWTEDDGSFAVGETGSVSIREAASGKVRTSFPVEGATAVDFASESGSDKSLFATLSGSGELCVWEAGKDGASPASISFIGSSLNGDEVPVSQLRFTALAFSRNSDYMACGMQDGGIRLFFKLRFSRQFIMREAGGQTGRITALSFSPDGRFLASASEDGSILLFNVTAARPVAKLPFYAVQTGSPVDFAPDGTLAAVLDSKSILLYGTDGEQKGSLITDTDIKAIRFQGGSGMLAVQAADGSISFYNTATGEQSASIPPLQATPLCTFAFSGDGEELLEGYDDGSIWLLTVADYMRQDEPPAVPEPAVAAAPDPVQAEPVAEQPAPKAEEPAAKAEPVTEEPVTKEPVAGEENQEPEKKTFLSNFNPEGRNSISVQAGGRLLQDPYDAALELDASFRMGTLFPPFYAGAALSGQIGKCFDAEEFPNQYTWKGEELAPPMTEAISLYAPIGVEFAIRDSAFRVFSELHAGAREVMLWQTCDEGTLRSEPHFVPMGGLYMGALFHGFMLRGGVDFDPVQRFVPGLLIGYSLTLPRGGKN